MAKKRSQRIEEILHGLNDVQRAILDSQPGPVLVLAGAGSGKTRVLTRRIAMLLERDKAGPEQILAVTFTNKASREMKNRLKDLLDGDFKHIWVGTFHSCFARILRSESGRIGYSRNFAILDSDDQLQVIRQILSEFHISAKEFPPQAIRAEISKHKNKMVPPQALSGQIQDRFEDVVHRVYAQYHGILKTNNSMDFDDLITLPVKLYREHPDVLARYQERFHHILVDEYQDTNLAQNELVTLLGSHRKSVFVVGDDDQSIYGWRGAEVRNIIEFEQKYENCQVFRLEQNYRSTKTILAAAHCVVSNNKIRKDKRLWTAREDGEPIVLMEAYDEGDEANKILNRIRHEIGTNKHNFQDFVVLYRTNSQSRAIEDVLRRNAIAYEIVGGIKFYERREIKDFLAYLRVIANPLDEISLRRIINVPSRGIGKATVEKLRDFAADNEISLLESLQKADEVVGITASTKTKARELGDVLQKYISLKTSLGLDELARVLNDEIGLLRIYKEEGTIEALNRMDNLQELLSAISEFCQARSNPSLDGFLEEVALVSDLDDWNDQSNAITLMTLHSAKGLEFPVVFIAGMEEGLFPLFRSKEDPADLEEERRLFYVGLTRAENKVYLSWARSRRRFADGTSNIISGFVAEIDTQYLEQLVAKTAYYQKSAYREPVYDPMPDYENESQEVPLHTGSRVRHDIFGLGIIKSMEGSGDNLKLIVDFREHGMKKLLYRYAQLELV